MKKLWMLPGLVVAVLFVWGTMPALADDAWDLGAAADDTPFSFNELRHAARQTHDLDNSGGQDFDWMVVNAVANHSYEARIHSASHYIAASTNYYSGIYYSTIARVDYFGYTLTDSVSIPAGYFTGATVRWIQGTTNFERVRVTGATTFCCDANDQYDVEVFDTTYFVPRWNNSGTQITVFLIQNNTDATVTGSIFFYDNSGALVHTAALSVPVQGLQILNTSSVGALAGLSGSAAVAHTGGWGALAGKAVALEPSTGFSFDTPLTPVPR